MTPKKPYVTPRLIDHGRVSDLTKTGTNSANPSDGGGGGNEYTS